MPDDGNRVSDKAESVTPMETHETTNATEALQAATSQLQAVTETATSAAQSVADSAKILQAAAALISETAPTAPASEAEIPPLHPEAQAIVDQMKEVIAPAVALAETTQAATTFGAEQTVDAPISSPQQALEVLSAAIGSPGANTGETPSASAQKMAMTTENGDAKPNRNQTLFMLVLNSALLVVIVVAAIAILDLRGQVASLKAAINRPQQTTSQFFWPAISADTPFAANDDLAAYDAILGKQMAGVKNRPIREAILTVLRESNAVSNAIQRNIDALKKGGKTEKESVIEGFLSDSVVDAAFNGLPEKFQQSGGVKYMNRSELETIYSYAKDNIN